MPIGFIGDVHSKFNRYDTILKHAEYPTIQVGDLGVGFLRQDGDPYPNPPHNRMVSGGHRFIRGNNDNPGICRRQSTWIPDGRVEITPKGTKIMFIGGAWSIDRDLRTQDVDWWADEELSYQQLDEMIDKANDVQPDVIMSHDCPESVAYKLFLTGTHKPVLSSRTGQAFNALFHFHKPKLWVFGHWHASRDQVIDGTRFVCLAELEHRVFDV